MRRVSYRVWRGMAVAGFVLTVAPLIYGFLDAVFGLYRSDLEYVLDAIPLGIVLMYVGCIGWARYLSGGWRFSIAIPLVALPLLILAVDSNMHGGGAAAFLIGVPALILAGIVLLIPRRKHDSQDQSDS